MPKMNWTIRMLGAIASIGTTVMVGAAIAQPSPRPQAVPISDALERLSEYLYPYYRHQLGEGAFNPDAPLPIPEPVSVSEAFQNLADNFYDHHQLAQRRIEYSRHMDYVQFFGFCAGGWATNFAQDIATMEDMLQTMDTELQQLIDAR